MDIELIDPIWAKVSATVAEAMRLSPEESKAIETNRVAKLIGLLPFLCECEFPHRVAISHLGTYVMACRGRVRAVFDHAPGDDAAPAARLRTISGFPGGNPAIAERGMALLCLCMLSGYVRDAAVDAALGQYNPVGSGAWDPVSMKAQLETTILQTMDATMDSILDIPVATAEFWDI